MTYNIAPSGRIYDEQGVEVPQDDREQRYQAYAAWLAQGNGPAPIEEPEDQVDPSLEIMSAQEWGLALVRGFEADAVKSGINNDPRAALSLDRYLREVSAALSAGRLHVAYAALLELLSTEESERPSGAGDDRMAPILNLIAARLDLPVWRGK